MWNKNLLKYTTIFSMVIVFIGCQTDNMDSPLNINEIDIIDLKDIELMIDFEEYGLIMPWQIEISQDGRIFVLDIQTNHVLIFGLDGNLIHRFGGQGRGPGEFIGARYLQISDNKVYIIDINLLRINVFNHSGEFLQAFHFDTGMSRRIVTVMDEETYFAAAMGRDGKLIRKVHSHSDSTLSFGESLGIEFQPGNMDFERRKLQQGEIPDLFKNEITMYYSNNYLYVFLNAYSRIQKYDQDGNLVWDQSVILPINEIIFGNVVERAQEPGATGTVPDIQYITSMKAYYESLFLFWVPVDGYPRQLVKTDSNGNVVLIYRVPESEPMFFDFTVDKENDMLYLIAPEMGQIYRASIPN
ncbi:hypothetical protein BH23THE1_BH23THE1_14790 [soil metagenome]